MDGRRIGTDGSAGDPADGSALSPAQATLRLLIEVAALVCWAVVGWELGGDTWGWVLAVGLPMIGATVWASFRVPGDASAGQGAPIAVPGTVRLLIEIDVLLGGAVLAMIVGQIVLGGIVAIAVVAHYALTAPRVRWLLAQRAPSGG